MIIDDVQGRQFEIDVRVQGLCGDHGKRYFYQGSSDSLQVGRENMLVIIGVYGISKKLMSLVNFTDITGSLRVQRVKDEVVFTFGLLGWMILIACI